MGIQRPEVLIGSILLLACGGVATGETFKSEAGRFWIAMPGTPKESQQTVPTAAGNVTLNTFSVESADGAHVVSYADYPDKLLAASSADAMLDGAASGTVSNTKGTLIRSARITQDGAPGRELVWSIPLGTTKGLARSRILLVGNRLYQVLVVGSEGMVQSPAAMAFLKSFRFQQAKAAAEPASKTSASKTATSEKNGTRWISFNVKNKVDGGWSVQVPGRPQRKQEPGILGARNRTVFTTTADGLTYTVQVQNVPPAAMTKGAATVLAADREAMIAQTKGTPSADSEATLGGSPATEYRIEIASGRPRVVRVRAAIFNNRLYTLSVAGTGEAVSGEDADRFFDTLKLNQ